MKLARYYVDRDLGDEQLHVHNIPPCMSDVCHCGTSLDHHKYESHTFTPMEEPPEDYVFWFECKTVRMTWIDDLDDRDAGRSS